MEIDYNRLIIGMIILMIVSFISGYYFYESSQPYQCDQKAYNYFLSNYERTYKDMYEIINTSNLNSLK